jgi:hypothetical protein
VRVRVCVYMCLSVRVCVHVCVCVCARMQYWAVKRRIRHF